MAKMVISIGGAFLIPVKLDGIAREAKTNLHEYHIDCGGASGRKRCCKACNKELFDTDIIKGLEINKGQVVTFSKEELANLPLTTAKNIEIDCFVRAEELNQLTFDNAYYLAPDEIGVSAFNLFMRGMKELNKVAIGKVAIKQRENLCVVYPMNNELIMSTMFWNEEMKDAPQVPKSEITDVQLDLITQVIDKFSKAFNYADYSDRYLNALREMAQRKISGQPITTIIEQQQPQQTLEESLRALIKE